MDNSVPFFSGIQNCSFAALKQRLRSCGRSPACEHDAGRPPNAEGRWESTLAELREG
jgi:hypothetical protein